MRSVALACVCVVGCLANHDPGTPMGMYLVTGTLKTQTCGAGGQGDNPWQFSVRLSRSGYQLFWLQGASPPVSGFIDNQGNATLDSSATFDLSQSDSGARFCSVIRTDKFTGALGTGIPSQFTGAIAYHYDVVEGADCTAELTLAGYTTMPCDVGYDLAATRSGP